MERLGKRDKTTESLLGKKNRFNLEDVVDDMKNGFYVADSQGNISFSNQAFARMLGYESKDEILGVNMAEKLYENSEDRATFLKRLQETGYLSDYEVKMVRKDGLPVVISVKSSFISDEDGTPIGVRGLAEPFPAEAGVGKKKVRAIPGGDIQEGSNGKDFYSMIHDSLTGLYAYEYFMTCLEAEIRRVEWMFRPMSMMMIDIDDFNTFNDKFGREQGDQLLKRMAGILKETLRPGDIICRQAQDQFLVILPEIKKEDTLALAKKLKDEVQAKLTADHMTCSIGMSRFICGMSSKEFFLQANLGLYMAKEAGKNEACIYG
ncbi:MAG: sensor domain-containing diguanylate cyclase [Candidatus Omnitrophica bacterium]|nr:sensor domain-containing diguanylate cyclase [Candidatus Omnitrophota bacterium]